MTMHDDFVFVDELVPGIRWDAKYATWDNFTGKPVDGYLANRIVGSRALCAALGRGASRRPPPSASACSCGTAIALNAPWIASCAGRNSPRTAGRSCGTTRTSTGPRCSSRGYVAAKSGHSRGSTVDLTLYHLATGELLPMGGDHDLMDPISHHGARGITPAKATNRQHLLLHHGGRRLHSVRLRVVALHPRDEPYPDTYFDFPVG